MPILELLWKTSSSICFIIFSYPDVVLLHSFNISERCSLIDVLFLERCVRVFSDGYRLLHMTYWKMSCKFSVTVRVRVVSVLVMVIMNG